mgnify:CR=1 FL=1
MSWFDIIKRKKSKKKKHPALKRAGVSAFNKPKRTPDHPTKSHVVVSRFKETPKSKGYTVRLIRFGQQGVKTNQTAGQRRAFKGRHKKDIKRGKGSAAYWADKVKWSPSKTKEKKNKKWRKGS